MSGILDRLNGLVEHLNHTRTVDSVDHQTVKDAVAEIERLQAKLLAAQMIRNKIARGLL